MSEYDGIMNRALIDDTRERNAFWKSTDFLKCFENSISLKTVKVAQEANRRFVDDYDYSGEDKKKERKREKSSDRKNDDKEPRKKRRK